MQLWLPTVSRQIIWMSTRFVVTDKTGEIETIPRLRLIEKHGHVHPLFGVFPHSFPLFLTPLPRPVHRRTGPFREHSLRCPPVTGQHAKSSRIQTLGLLAHIRYNDRHLSHGQEDDAFLSISDPREMLHLTFSVLIYWTTRDRDVIQATRIAWSFCQRHLQRLLPIRAHSSTLLRSLPPWIITSWLQPVHQIHNSNRQQPPQQKWLSKG